MLRKIQLPAAAVGLLLLLVVVFLIQGWRMASQRHDLLLPRRAVATIEHPQRAPLILASADARGFLAVDLGPTTPERLGLYQVFPERSLVRWIEDLDEAGEVLVVPLRGLPVGRYAVCAVDLDAAAGPREMDLPVEELDVRARFELR